MGFASIDAMVKALSNGRKQEWRFAKNGAAGVETPEAAGNAVSYYLAAGSPGAGTAPTTSWASFTSGSGSVFFTDVASNKRYLYGVEACATQNCTLIAYDRLGHKNFNANALASTGDKTVTATLPSRMSTAETEDLHNVEAWIEVTEATATSAPVVSLNSYTNTDGTSGRAGGTLTFPAVATDVGWMAPFPLQAGDKGVQAINTFNVATASTGQGECNVVMLRPLFSIPLIANILTMLTVKDGLVPRRIYDGSSICFMIVATGTSVANIWGSIITAYDGG